MIRPIFSARTAEGTVTQALEAIVKGAIAIGRADGQFTEAEVESLVDAVRDVAAQAVGPERVTALVPTPRLLDWAREGVQQLRTEGRGALMSKVASLLTGDFRRHALGVAFRVITADGVMTEKELEAFRQLARAVGLEEAERDLVETLNRAGRPGIVRDSDVEAVRVLLRRGWQEPEVARHGAADSVAWYDTTLHFNGPLATLRLDLDAPERVLHLYLDAPDGGSAHVLFAYGTSPAAIIAAIDAEREALSLKTLHEHLGRWVAFCPDTFLEQQGQLKRVPPATGRSE